MLAGHDFINEPLRNEIAITSIRFILNFIKLSVNHNSRLHKYNVNSVINDAFSMATCIKLMFKLISFHNLDAFPLYV